MYQKAQKAGMTVKAYKAMLARQKETASPTIRSDFPETEPIAEEKQGPSGPLVDFLYSIIHLQDFIWVILVVYLLDFV